MTGSPDVSEYTVTWRLSNGESFTITGKFTDPEEAAERMFIVANGMDEGPDGARWAQLQHRSLGVGDHVRVNETPYLCDSSGWRPSRETDPKNMEDLLRRFASGGDWSL